MELTLKPETEALIHHALESGRFANADILISTAINLLSDSTPDEHVHLRAKIDEGWDAAERGDTITSDDFEAEMDGWRSRVHASL